MATSKIKLVHVVNSLDIGGMENGVINICNLIDRNLFEPIVCCINGHGAMANRLIKDVKIFDMRFGGVNFIFYVLKLAQLFVKEHVSIVHTHGWGAGSFVGILAAKLARIPCIINGEHGTFFINKKQILLQKILFKLCDQNLAVSETLRERVANIFSVAIDDIKVLKNGVDTKKFSGVFPKEKIIQQMNDEGYLIDASSFNIFMIGSLKPVKAQHILLKAIAGLQKHNKPTKIKVFFVGDGPERAILEEETKRLGIKEFVYFLGKRHDVPRLLSIAHVLVSTSVSEGLSNVILEAMSSGVAVIATSTGSEEIVTHGETGFLIEQGDYISLKKYILVLMHNRTELKRLADNATALIHAEYSIHRMIQNYEKLYIDALGTN